MTAAVGSDYSTDTLPPIRLLGMNSTGSKFLHTAHLKIYILKAWGWEAVLILSILWDLLVIKNIETLMEEWGRLLQIKKQINWFTQQWALFRPLVTSYHTKKPTILRKTIHLSFWWKNLLMSIYGNEHF